MKKVTIPLSALFLMAAVAVAPGCSGGDDDDDDDDGGALESGTYAITVNPLSSTCFDDSTYTEEDNYYFPTEEATVTVSGASLNVEFDFGDEFSYDIDGTDLLDPSSPGAGAGEFDFTDPAVATSNGLSAPVDCVVDLGVFYRGEIVDSNSFTLSDDFELTQASGTECQALVTSGLLLSPLPCFQAQHALEFEM